LRIKILPLALPLLAQVNGYMYFSSVFMDYQGQRSLSLLSAARVNLRWERGPLKLKISPVLFSLAAEEGNLFLLTGFDPGASHSLFLIKQRDLTSFLSLDRASLTLYLGRLSLTLGRDRYPWGKARFFSLLDRFNPYNPFSLLGERQGTDGGRLRFYLSDFSWAEGIYARRSGRSLPLRSLPLFSLFKL